MKEKRVYFFGNKTAEGNGGMKEHLGGKSRDVYLDCLNCDSCNSKYIM